MKTKTAAGFFSSPWIGITRLLTALLLLYPWNAQATAPRITAQLFGEERKSDIVGYQVVPEDAADRSDSDAAAELITAAFLAAGKTLTLDMLPARQLAVYALLNNEAAALIGSSQDVPEKDKNQYRTVTFSLRIAVPGDQEPLLLIFAKKHQRGNELYQAFNAGLQKLVKSGRYLQILENHYGKDRVPADYFSRLQRHNPALK